MDEAEEILNISKTPLKLRAASRRFASVDYRCPWWRTTTIVPDDTYITVPDVLTEMYMPTAP